MTQRSGQTAVITGASAGLGACFAKLFAKDGHDLVLVARRKDALDKLAAELESAHGIKAHVVALDLTQPGAPQAIYKAVKDKGIATDFLVNNAGFGSTGPFVELDTRRELDMIAVNVTALVELSRLFLPDMVARKKGRILNIGSTAGFQAGPFMATYYASKAFVISFSEALFHEVAGTGVTVTVSCPGATATEFAMVANNDKTRLFQQGGVATSESVAKQAYNAMMRGQRMIIHGFKNRAMYHSLRLSPRKFVQKIAGAMNKPA